MTAPVHRQGGRAAPAQLCREAIELIERARQEHPRQLSEDVDEAERAVVRLRDELIDRLRAAAQPGALASIQPSLKAVNAALSLIVGVEYPAGGIHRKLLEQAGAALSDLLKSGQLGETA